MAGKDYLVHLSSDGTSGGTKTEVEYQGDLTVNEGKSAERTKYKNGVKTSVNEDGWSATFDMALDEPIPAGIALALAASDAGSQTYMWIESATAGARRWEGLVKCLAGDTTLGTDGEPSVSVTLSEDGDITTGVTA